MTRPLTGSLKMAVETILPCHVASRGSPVFTETSFIVCLSCVLYRQEWLCLSIRRSWRNVRPVFEMRLLSSTATLCRAPHHSVSRRPGAIGARLPARHRLHSPHLVRSSARPREAPARPHPSANCKSAESPLRRSQCEPAIWTCFRPRKLPLDPHAYSPPAAFPCAFILYPVSLPNATPAAPSPDSSSRSRPWFGKCSFLYRRALGRSYSFYLGI